MEYIINIRDVSDKSHNLIKLLQSLEKDNDFLNVTKKYQHNEISQDMVNELDHRYMLHKKDKEEGYTLEEIKQEIKDNEK